MLLSENMCLLSPFYKSTIFPVFESRGANLSFNESCMLSSSSPARNSGFNPFLYTPEKFSKRSLKSSHQGISKQLTSSFCSMQNTYSFIFSEETHTSVTNVHGPMQQWKVSRTIKNVVRALVGG